MAIKLAVIGAGNMGAAILDGVLVAETEAGRAGGSADGLRLGVDEVVVCDRDQARLSRWADAGVRVTTSPAGAAAGLGAGAGHLLLAVKPQSFGGVAAELRAGAGVPAGCGVISIMAGATIAAVGRELGVASGVTRAMPNLPAKVRRGVTAMVAGPGVTNEQGAFAESLFAAVGGVIWIEESLIDAFTALAGSGPAYVFYLCEAMTLAGERVGFDAETAERVARATVVGAAALLAGSGEAAPNLRRAVTSKGGTTEAAVAVLDSGGVMQAVGEAVVAGRDRARALAVRPE